MDADVKNERWNVCLGILRGRNIGFARRKLFGFVGCNLGKLELHSTKLLKDYLSQSDYNP